MIYERGQNFALVSPKVAILPHVKRYDAIQIQGLRSLINGHFTTKNSRMEVSSLQVHLHVRLVGSPVAIYDVLKLLLTFWYLWIFCRWITLVELWEYYNRSFKFPQNFHDGWERMWHCSVVLEICLWLGVDAAVFLCISRELLCLFGAAAVAAATARFYLSSSRIYLLPLVLALRLTVS